MPPASLVAEVNAGLQQLFDTYLWFGQFGSLFYALESRPWRARETRLGPGRVTVARPESGLTRPVYGSMPPILGPRPG
jgi:hypothetical protein